MYDTGYSHIRNWQIVETFGVDYKNLDFSEKRMIWYFSIQRSQLEIIQGSSGIALSDILGEKKLSDEECNFAKVLTMAKVDVPSFKQIYVGGQYKVPATIQVIGLNGELYGVMVRVYNPDTISFQGSVFLIPSNTLSNMQTTKSKNSAKRPFSIEDYKKKFPILELLESYGYDKLFKALIKKGQSRQPTIDLLSLTSKFSSHVAPLEHFVNPADLLRLKFSSST